MEKMSRPCTAVYRLEANNIPIYVQQSAENKTELFYNIHWCAYTEKRCVEQLDCMSWVC